MYLYVAVYLHTIMFIVYTVPIHMIKLIVVVFSTAKTLQRFKPVRHVFGITYICMSI